nr:DUF1924 domain-containing protein [Pelomicrobium methylotrophicum]
MAAGVLETYRLAAGAGFVPSPERGAAFFRKPFGHTPGMPACTSCHTDNPARPGRHAVTGKTIEPLAPAANPARLTDPAKVEKWFRRNCREVVGRECTAAEKADVLAYLMGVR